MSSRDFGFLTLRNTMAYQPNGFRVPPNNIFVTGVNGGAFFSNDVSVSSLSVSTLNTGTINISTLNTSTITANTISTNILAANYISTYQQLVFFDNNFSTCVLDNIGSTLYIDGHPVVTDAIVSTVSSVYWNGGPNGTIYNKNIGLAPNYYQVGIGTAGGSLSATLDVNGSINASSYLSTPIMSMPNNQGRIIGLSTINGLAWPPVDDALWSQSGNNIYNDNSGNVGIGTTTPSYKLDVNGTCNVSTNLTVSSCYVSDGLLVNDVDVGGPGLKLAGGQQQNGMFIKDGETLSPAAYDGYFIGNSGTYSTPSTFVISRLNNGTSGGQNAIYLTQTGNVGIGVYNPAYKLDVDGTTNISGNLTVSGSAISKVSCASAATLTSANFGQYCFINGAGQTLALPAGVEGAVIVIRNIGTGSITITGTADASGTSILPGKTTSYVYTAQVTAGWYAL